MTDVILCVAASVVMVAPPIDRVPIEIEGKSLQQWIDSLETVNGRDLEYVVSRIDRFRQASVAAIPTVGNRLRTLPSQDCNGRAILCAFLLRWGKEARVVLPELLFQIQEGDVRTAEHAQYVIRTIGPSAKTAIPALVQSYYAERHSSLYREELLETLVRIDPKDMRIRDVLNAALQNTQDVVRVKAARAHWLSGNQVLDYPDHVRKGVRSGETQARLVTVHFIPHLIAKYPDLIGYLFEFLGDRDSDVREATVQVLREVKPRSDRAFRAYSHGLESPCDSVRYFSVNELARFGEKAKNLLPSLRPLLHDKNEFVRAQTAFVCWTLDKDNRQLALKHLCDGLDSSSPDARCLAARLLGEMGRESEPAIPKLQLCLRDDWNSVRKEAVNALAKIKQGAR